MLLHSSQAQEKTETMDESARGAIELAIALRDAHFQLKRLAGRWEDQLPAGTVQDRGSLGPTWHYGEDPRQAAYLDGQTLLLTQGRTLTCELIISLHADQVDMLARAAWESDDQSDGADLASTGPLEFPTSSRRLAQEIRQCVEHLAATALTTLTR